jgi:hypothetical protein
MGVILPRFSTEAAVNKEEHAERSIAAALAKTGAVFEKAEKAELEMQASIDRLSEIASYFRDSN